MKKMRGILLLLLLLLILPFISSISVTHVVSDHLGSPVIAGDYKTDYEPFGKTFNEEGENRHGYNAKELDDTGLNYYGARYYQNEIGRFTNADILIGKITNPQSLNRYVYTHNNPLYYIDPTGMQVAATKGNALVIVANPNTDNNGALKSFSKTVQQIRDAGYIAKVDTVSNSAEYFAAVESGVWDYELLDTHGFTASIDSSGRGDFNGKDASWALLSKEGGRSSALGALSFKNRDDSKHYNSGAKIIYIACKGVSPEVISSVGQAKANSINQPVQGQVAGGAVKLDSDLNLVGCKVKNIKVSGWMDFKGYSNLFPHYYLDNNNEERIISKTNSQIYDLENNVFLGDSATFHIDPSRIYHYKSEYEETHTTVHPQKE